MKLGSSLFLRKVFLYLKTFQLRVFGKVTDVSNSNVEYKLPMAHFSKRRFETKLLTQHQDKCELEFE